jgi:hypothetical protein
VRIIRCSFIALGLLIGIANPAHARVDIDLNFSVAPEFVVVPGYPVYYAPAVDRNFFFYDGQYWLFEDDEWYASDWYNGPWEYVDPDDVPLFVLRVPVRYYRRPPVYFRAWIVDAPPRWGSRWGGDWERHHSGWDRWDRHHVPPRAPLPDYHRDYPDNRTRDHDRDERHDQDRHDRDYRTEPRHDWDNNDRRRDSLPQRTQPDPRRDNPDRDRPDTNERPAAPQHDADNNDRVIHQRIPYQPRPPINRIQQQQREQQPREPQPHEQPRENPAPRAAPEQRQTHAPENTRDEPNEGRGRNNWRGRGDDNK